MYRRTAKYSAARQEAMQRGRSQSRMDQPAPDYPAELPDVRMRITVERFDLAAPERHEFELRRCEKVYTITDAGLDALAGAAAPPQVAAPRQMNIMHSTLDQLPAWPVAAQRGCHAGILSRGF